MFSAIYCPISIRAKYIQGYTYTHTSQFGIHSKSYFETGYWLFDGITGIIPPFMFAAKKLFSLRRRFYRNMMQDKIFSVNLHCSLNVQRRGPKIISGCRVTFLKKCLYSVKLSSSFEYKICLQIGL